MHNNYNDKIQFVRTSDQLYHKEIKIVYIEIDYYRISKLAIH